MKIEKLGIDGVFIVNPSVFADDRGYFSESFNLKEFRDKTGLDIEFVQDNESKSSVNVIRGLHFQIPPFEQAKLVRCVQGAVLDVAVDVRKGSPTYGRYEAVVLSEDNHRQLFIPRGFAHGFAVLSLNAVFQYKCDNYYSPQHEGGIAWDDPDIAITWNRWMSDAVKPKLSPKDTNRMRLSEFDSPFKYYI